MDYAAAKEVAEEIISLYQNNAGEYYAGEKVTQLEHMVQSAQLAEKTGQPEEVVLAAFLHDIGHICVQASEENQMDGWGTVDHEDIGADYLKKKGFSKLLIRLVESHVEAKRYLTAKNPDYYNKLSEASRQTLEFQGGRMNDDEMRAFESYPLFKQILAIRKFDDEAKIQNLPMPSLEIYRDMMIRHLLKNK